MNRSNGVASRQPAKAPQFFLSKNRRYYWVVRDRTHRRGGLFIDRVAPLRFAMDEAGDGPQAVIMVPGVPELELSSDQFDHIEAIDNPKIANDPIAERYCIAQDLI